MRNATLVFLVKRSEGKISDVCLAMKKRGFGVGRWNGAGGKVQPGESIEAAARRETEEEIGVIAGPLAKVAELEFRFPHKPDWDQMVHAYVCKEWKGEPSESEEMRPQWFGASDMPFKSMWPDDEFWLPKALAGSLIKARFSFGEGDVVLNQRVEEVSAL